MHHSGSVSEVGFLPSLPHLSSHEMCLSRGTVSASNYLPRASTANTAMSWERRCVRKHRRTDDDGCSAKRRRLMGDEGLAQTVFPYPKVNQHWSQDCSGNGPSTLPGPITQQESPPFSLPTAAAMPLQTLPRPYGENSIMEVEAAQRKLQEIEDRITLEDDDDEEDLDVEPAHRRPVLVMSDSLREGLQRGVGDILPHTVAQSVSHSCMELVLWRPPEDALTRRLKDSFQKQQQRKQYGVCRQTPTPSPTPGASSSSTMYPQPQPQPPQPSQASASSPMCCTPSTTLPTAEVEEMEL